VSAAVVLQIAVAVFALTPQVHVPTAGLSAGPIKPVAVAPDGSWAAFVSMGAVCDYDKDEGMGRVQVWDLRTGTLDRSFPAPGIWRAEPVVVSPDGRWLAYPGYRDILLHDFRTGARLHSFRDVGEENYPLGFSPDGKELYSAAYPGGGTRVVVWSTADGSKLREVKIPTNEGLTLSADAKFAVLQPSHGNKELWDLTTGKKVADLGRESQFGKPAFVRGGKELALLWQGYKSSEYRVTDLATTKTRVVSKFPDETPHPRWYAVADDLSAVALLEWYGGLKVYEPGKDKLRFHFAPKGSTSYEGPMFTPDGKRVIVTQPHQRAWVLDAVTGKPAFALDPDYRSVKALAFTADGKTLVAGVTDWRSSNTGGAGEPPDGFLMSWDTATGELKRAARGVDHYLHAVYPSPDGAKVVAITASNSDQAQWWDMATGKPAKVLAKANSRLQAFGGSADGRKFGAVKYEYVPRPDDKHEAALRATWVWDPATGERLPDLPAVASGYALRFTPDGERILYHNHGGAVRAVRTSGGKAAAVWKSSGSAGDPYPRDVAPLPDGEAFVSFHQPHQYGPHHLYLFDIGRAVKFGEVDIPVGPLAISPDGKWVAVSGRDSVYGVAGKPNPVYLWRVPELGPLDEKLLAGGKRVAPTESLSKRVTLAGHLGEVYAVAFSPDGKTLATGGRDRVIRLWDVETGELRASLWAAPPTDPAGVPTDWAAFTPEGFHAGTARGRASLRFAKAADPAALFRPDKVKEAVRGK
jgi:WD40 repeat protein